jgi:hypothetical protein
MTLAESTRMLWAAAQSEDMPAIEAALGARAIALSETRLADPEEISAAIDAGMAAMRSVAAIKSRVAQVRAALGGNSNGAVDYRG